MEHLPIFCFAVVSASGNFHISVTMLNVLRFMFYFLMLQYLGGCAETRPPRVIPMGVGGAGVPSGPKIRDWEIRPREIGSVRRYAILI